MAERMFIYAATIFAVVLSSMSPSFYLVDKQSTTAMDNVKQFILSLDDKDQQF